MISIDSRTICIFLQVEFQIQTLLTALQRHRPAPSAAAALKAEPPPHLRNTHLFLSFTYVCPEPVLVK
jgi:hypothetical protein